jgi:hypothetical protein
VTARASAPIGRVPSAASTASSPARIAKRETAIRAREVGHGSTFTLAIPLQTGAPAVADPASRLGA